MTTTTNLNSFPFYDDYDGAKGFHRVLFKPGYAVQARELTQLQSLLQEQIKRFGDNIFKDGSVISGAPESTNFNMPYIKIQATSLDISAYEGLTVVGANENVTAVIKKTTQDLPDIGNPTVLYVQYTSQGDNKDKETFDAGETLTLESNPLVVFTIDVIGTTPIGKGSLLTLGTGIVYAKGLFVMHQSQTVVVDAFTTTPTKKVGFVVIEDIIDSTEDVTLLDPAQGSYNYTAPGADRYKVTTELKSYSPADVPAEGFYILFDVLNGQIARRYDQTQYAELNRTMARRTYDESGNYVVKPFALVAREARNDGAGNGGLSLTGDASKLAIGVEPGKGYVSGFEYETFATIYLEVDKGTAFETIQNAPTSTFYGSYVVVDELAGPWASLNTGTIVSLRDVAAGAVTATTFSATAAPGAQIGTARINFIQFLSGVVGTATAKYKIHLQDVVITDPTKTFADVLGIYSNEALDCHADIATAPGALLELENNNMLFLLPQQNVKTLAPGALDNQFVFQQKFTPASSASPTVSLSGSDVWAFSSTAASLVDVNIIMISGAGAVIKPTSVTYTNSQNLTLNTGLGADTYTIFINVQRTNVTPVAKTLKKTQYVKIQVSKNFTGATAGTGSTTITGLTIAADDVARGDKVWDSTFRLLGTVATFSATTIDLVANSGYIVAAGTIIVTHPSYSPGTVGKFTGPISLGFSDLVSVDGVWIDNSTTAFASMVLNSTTSVLSEFKVDVGQRDNYYEPGSMSTPARSTYDFASKRLVVKVTYFTSTPGNGYFSVNSYPLPAQGTAASASEIEWYQIPVFTGSNGIRYDLRNVIDFRSVLGHGYGTKTSDGTSAQSGVIEPTTVALALLNPVALVDTTRVFPASFNPNPLGLFTTDLSYNLGRIDRIVLDREGSFTSITGSPAARPAPEKVPENAMTLGFVTISPFPSLGSSYANQLGRREYGTRVSLIDNRRYTMRDISNIDTRLVELQKFTKFSLLEQRTINMMIANTSGENRFKNGVLVDSFERHNIGNQGDNTYNCSIANGILAPAAKLENIKFEKSSTSLNVATSAADVHIVVEQLFGAIPFEVGEVASSSSGAAGTIKHVVTIASDASSGYSWVRLYLEEVTGVYGVGNTITGLTSTATGTLNTTNLTSAILAADLQPELFVVAAAGNLVTLPYTHTMYTENPYASEAINTTSNIIFNYEGVIGMNPASDTWFDIHTPPAINVIDTIDVPPPVQIIPPIIITPPWMPAPADPPPEPDPYTPPPIDPIPELPPIVKRPVDVPYVETISGGYEDKVRYWRPVEPEPVWTWITKEQTALYGETEGFWTGGFLDDPAPLAPLTILDSSKYNEPL